MQGKKYPDNKKKKHITIEGIITRKQMNKQKETRREIGNDDNDTNDNNNHNNREKRRAKKKGKKNTINNDYQINTC